MKIGTVKFFNATRGFGFIEPADGEGEVFIHISALERAGLTSLVEGQKLRYEVVQDPVSGRIAAENVQAL
jgi:Cold shock proteins